MLKKDAHLVEKGTRGFEELFHPLQGNRKKETCCIKRYIA